MYLLPNTIILTEGNNENDREREETIAGTAPIGGSPGQRPGKGAKGQNKTADSGGRYFGESLSRCGDDGSGKAGGLFVMGIKMKTMLLLTGRPGKPERPSLLS